MHAPLCAAAAARRPPRLPSQLPVPLLCPNTCLQATQFNVDLGFAKKKVALGFTKSNVRPLPTCMLGRVWHCRAPWLVAPPRARPACRRATTAAANCKPQPSPGIPSLLPENPTCLQELFVGRAAMLGVAFAIVGELLTGRGALAQLGYEVRLPAWLASWPPATLRAQHGLAPPTPP